MLHLMIGMAVGVVLGMGIMYECMKKYKPTRDKNGRFSKKEES